MVAVMGLALLAAGAVALLLIAPRLASAASTTPSAAAVAAKPIEQLVDYPPNGYRGAVIVQVPAEIRRRLQAHYEAAGPSGNYQAALKPATAEEFAANDAKSERFDAGHAPANIWGDWGTYATGHGGGPTDRFVGITVNFRKQQNVFQKVAGTLLPAAANLILPGSGNVVKGL